MNKQKLVRVVPNKTVLFHTSENGDVSVYVQKPAIRELHTQGVKLSTSCNATEGHTTSAGYRNCIHA